MSHERNIIRGVLRGWMGGCVLVWLVSVGTLGAEQTYVVKRNDTLYGIARQFKLTPAQLAARNGISRNTKVIIGQKLVIPAKETVPLLSAPVQRAIDAAQVSPRWKYVVLHHSGVDEGSLKSLDRYHREERHMENGLAYHFLIGNGNGMGDGEIAVGNRWHEQLDGGHLREESQNKVALGICLIGNFDETKPTEKQMRSLENLVRVLMKRCGLSVSAVKTHQQINVVHTRCPGTKFPESSFLAKLKKTEQ
ncbi:MAG: N-acetylmuramoyl-L-alanine amidase [Verrucomicrobiota bacterium]